MTYRRQEMEVEQREAQSLYRKPIEPWFVSIRPVISYMLREQRLLFVLVGIAIATLAFTILSPSSNQPIPGYGTRSSIQSVRSCYDEGKRTAETLVMDYHRGANVEVRIARIFNTYGPRMCIDDGRVVSNFVAQALRKEPLTVYGDGKQTRSFQFVSDLVEGLMRLMEGRYRKGEDISH
ncbi:hypothetical protein YC2023_020512 [Brassica napus]